MMRKKYFSNLNYFIDIVAKSVKSKNIDDSKKDIISSWFYVFLELLKKD
jgi:hypothetical protein